MVADGQTIHQITFTDAETDQCFEEIVTEPVTCSNNCLIEIGEYEILECGAGQFYLAIEYEYLNPVSELEVYANNQLTPWSVFPNNSLLIGPLTGDGSTEYEILLTDAEADNCFDSLYLAPVDCIGDCEIYNVNALPLPCNAQGEYYVQLRFGNNNPGGSGFMVVGDGVFYGLFDYNQLPLTLGPFSSGGPNLEFNVFDVENPMCIGFVEIESQVCDEDCELANLHVDFVECDGQIAVYELDVEYNQAVSDSFQLYYNNTPWQVRAYSDLPILIGANPNQVGTVFNVGLCDLEYPNCCIFADVELADSCTIDPPCEISDLTVEAGLCNDLTIEALIDFNVTQPVSDSFVVFINNQLYGTYPYSQRPLVVGPLPAIGPTVYEFIVCDAEDETCIGRYILEVNCVSDCRINQLLVEPHSCDNGFFIFDIDVSAQNTSDSIQILINNEIIGDFTYTDFPIQAGPFLGDGQTNWYIGAFDLEFDNCFLDTLLQPVDCDFNPNCEIFDLTVETLDCTSDSTYNLLIDFNY
ncbi:MAG: hypothetical protein AAFP19_26950, partial [Bacteroidota bacterium]